MLRDFSYFAFLLTNITVADTDTGERKNILMVPFFGSRQPLERTTREPK